MCPFDKENSPEEDHLFHLETPAHESQRLLIVDDDPTILSLLEEFCTRLGFSYRSAGDGEEALSLLEQAPCTILITDLVMPKVDGMTLMKKVKEVWPDTDILVMTGYSREFSYTDVIRAGASDFIKKPFNLDELEAKLNRIIRERALRTMLKRLSIRDPLTDLYNRRFFEQRLEEEAERANRQDYSLFLLMIDLDNFKEVNDTQGHIEGDRILKVLAEVLTNSTRHHVDTPFRYGGDEFAVIIPQATESQVEQIAERIRKNYQHSDNIGNTTVSVGVSRFENTSQKLRENLNRLIHQADDAMYIAKKTGGNRVVVYGTAKQQG